MLLCNYLLNLKSRTVSLKKHYPRHPFEKITVKPFILREKNQGTFSNSPLNPCSIHIKIARLFERESWFRVGFGETGELGIREVEIEIEAVNRGDEEQKTAGFEIKGGDWDVGMRLECQLGGFHRGRQR